MLRLLSAILASIVLALIAPSLTDGVTHGPGASPLAMRVQRASFDHVAYAAAAPRRFKLPALVGLKVSVGYRGQYRASAWVPVRITLRNHVTTQVAGTVTIPDSGGGNQYATPSFSSMYSESVVLPPGGAKRLTVYLPGRDVGDSVKVKFLLGSQVVASTSNSPASAGDSTVTVGALSGDPQLAAWITQGGSQAGRVDVIGLTPGVLDPVAEALSTFDAIVLTNIDAAQLTHDQLVALERYVEMGGSLLLVGGPDWQETLRPLPAMLVPGTLAGAQTVTNLAGLYAIGAGGMPRKPTVVSRLIHPRGYVVAQQAGIPLIVRNRLGSGRVIYLAFDPALDPIASWPGVGGLSSSLIQLATPQVINRLSATGFQSGLFRDQVGASIIRQELANVPGATQPTLLLLVLLVLLSILILGPLNFLVFRRLRKPELGWIALPVLAVALLAVTVSTTLHFKGSLVLLNVIGVVQLDGSSQSHPAAFYVGLFSSVRGAYHMVWNDAALPQGLPQYSFDGGSGSSLPPVGMSLSEGAQTTVDFPSMNMWATRSVALRTSVTINGAVGSDLHVAPDGAIVGTVRNDTNLTLMEPAILAGSAVLRLAELRPHTTQVVRVQPSADIQDRGVGTLWDRIYGTSATSTDFGSWDGDPWEAPTPGTEVSLIDRLRNVGDRLPGGENLPTTSGVVLLGWSENTLGSLTVDGATPRRRDLNLIEASLPIQFPRGAFQLRQGTLSAYLVGGRPQPPQNGCCPSSFGSTVVGIGAGGSAIFQFDIPNAPRVHFRRLVLSVNLGGADGSKVADVYDWRSDRWVHVNLGPIDVALTSPSRFISAGGALQVRLRSTTRSGDVVIADPQQDIQLSGTATVG